MCVAIMAFLRASSPIPLSLKWENRKNGTIFMGQNPAFIDVERFNGPSEERLIRRRDDITNVMMMHLYNDMVQVMEVREIGMHFAVLDIW